MLFGLSSSSRPSAAYWDFRRLLLILLRGWHLKIQIFGLLSRLTSPPSASVIGLYTSYAAPIFLRITSGRDKLKPGPFTLGRWAVPVGAIAVAWVAFIVVVLFFPPGQTINAQEMSMCINVISTFFKLTGTKIMPL